MRLKYIIHISIVLALLAGVLILLPAEARAHCDTMDGPVVKAAQRALATRNVNLVLIWVQEKDEAEIMQRFRQTLAVRRLNRQARNLADNYFFETLVRLHRAGEGEPYTGLKPAGTDLGPIIPLADEALQNGSTQALLNMFAASEQAEMQKRLQEIKAKRSFKEDDLAAGREFVKSYISFMHYVEHLYEERHKT
ncbi:MAG: DUF6448 family protein [Pyrinomonadaceae bacterium]